jgi:hypothetical protein
MVNYLAVDAMNQSICAFYSPIDPTRHHLETLGNKLFLGTTGSVFWPYQHSLELNVSHFSLTSLLPAFPLINRLLRNKVNNFIQFFFVKVV